MLLLLSIISPLKKYNLYMKTFLILIITSLSLIAQTPEESVKDFYENLSKQDYADTWDDSSKIFKNTIKKQQWKV